MCIDQCLTMVLGHFAVSLKVWQCNPTTKSHEYELMLHCIFTVGLPEFFIHIGLLFQAIQLIKVENAAM